MHAYVYEPSDDSYLLMNELKHRMCDKFLDMGCGSGIQSNNIKGANEIVCADINAEAVRTAKENVKGKNAKFVVSDLFENIEGRFDIIAFNTPYLDDSRPKDLSWTYLQNGRDIIKRFIVESKDYIAKNGAVLMIISNRSYNTYKEAAEKTGYEWMVLKTKNLFFEKLFLIEMRVKRG